MNLYNCNDKNDNEWIKKKEKWKRDYIISIWILIWNCKSLDYII